LKKIEIINACSDLGVDVNGAALGPKALTKHLEKVCEINTDVLQKEYEKENKKKNLDGINSLNEKIYSQVLQTLKKDKFPFVIGGDHSIAIGSALASIKKYRKMGIIWFDSHGDFNTFDTTVTGNIHGLPLAVITGFEKRNLSKFHDGEFYAYENTVIVGARDIDKWELPNIEKAGITVFTTEDIKKQGIEITTKKAIEIASKNTNGIHISYDLDLIDPRFAPGVSVPAKDGISVDDAKKIIDIVIKNKETVKSMDLVEFNPLKDIENKTEKIAKDILEKVMTELFIY